MRLNLKQLDAFRAVMVTGSTSDAALMLHLSQPAVSRSLQNLEEAIDYQLFIRKSGRLYPTTEAERLFAELDQLYSSFDHIAHVLKTIRPSGDGHLRIVASTPMAQRFLPAVFARFQASRPNASLSLRVIVKREAAKWLESQQFDLALLTMPIEYPAACTQHVATVDAVCILPPAHPLTARKFVDATDLADEHFISIVPGTTLRARIDQTFTSLGIDRSKLLLETQSGASICQMVAAGLGVSVIDSLNAEAFQHLGVVIRPFRPRLHFDYGLFVPIHRQLSSEARAFRDLLREMTEPLGGPRSFG
ncbi:LysR substrate-binding domain-containing protein [Pararhizobium haloflavum]|uniref:LysR substrate-binding domain-containing protein n=1 Tax=Pararhizobium haloflavum TaxID=2037914 RepID=UPI000C19AAE7|nr:LysR substrate-binding domain-containing protein [Pararhizobium haloflavum]